MADLGFDFADDRDDYDHLEHDRSDDMNDEQLDQQQQHQQQQQQLQSQDADVAFDTSADEANIYIPADRLIEPPPEEGYDTNSLLQSMLTEEVPQEELENSVLDGETLTPLECIYKYKDGESNAMIHRQLIAKELSNALYEVDVNEALQELLPLVHQIAYDDNDSVRETFAAELDKIIMYFYLHAPPLLDRDNNDKNESGAQGSHVPAKFFSQILIHLLLDQYSNVAALGQQCIVAVTAELMGTPASETDRAALDQQLIHGEIYQGVVLGLMDIIAGKRKPPTSDDDDSSAEYKPVKNDDDDHLSADLSATTLHSPTAPTSTHGVLRRPSMTPGFESSFMAPTSEELDQGEINLAKMMCLSLLSQLIPVLGTEKATCDCLPIVEELSQDAMFFVRKEAAVAIGSLAAVVEPQVAVDRLLPLYRAYTRDSIWHVRRSCLLTLPLLCGVMDYDTKVQMAVEAVEMFKNDVSRNVRNTLAEIIGELIAKFLPEDWETTGQPGQVPDALLEFFLSLGASSNSNQMFKLETDRALLCAYNFPAVVVTVGAGYWDSHLKETYLSLTKDYQIKVRRTFAYSLHEIARIIGPERTERDLVQIFALYLMDLDDVKQGVLEHLAEFLGTLAVSSRNEYIPILTEVWDGVMTNWRLRDILASQLREIALLFDAARVVEHILPLAIRACHDEFAAVRETGVEAFPVILDIVKRAVDEGGENLSHDGDLDDEEEDGPEAHNESKRNFALALLNHVMERLDEFVRSDMHRGRLMFTQICRALLEVGISPGDFASFFLPRLAPLTQDPIVNVRIGASRTVRLLYTNEAYRQELLALGQHEDHALDDEDPEFEIPPAQLLEQLLYRLALDTDMDVRLFAIDLVDPERLKEEQEIMNTNAAAAAAAAAAAMTDVTTPGSSVAANANGVPTIASTSSSSTSSIDNNLAPADTPQLQPSQGHLLMRKILNDDMDEEEDEMEHANAIIAEPIMEDQEPNAAIIVSSEDADPMVNGHHLETHIVDEPAPMDYTQDMQQAEDKAPKDEDGDALMTEASPEDDSKQDDPVDDDDDDDQPTSPSTAANDTEKSTFVYLSKSSPQDTSESVTPSLHTP
ncbi:armadillo-type protein [Gongronella butleri]|nr:armadillo-type protein [Gongronella butleri]